MKFSYDLLFGLPDEKIALFCLLGAQRMEGIYDKFCKKYLGGVNANSDALRELFELLEGGGKSRLELIYNRVYSAIPDTEDYDDELADQAQCAIISTSYCISYLVEKNREMARFAVEKIFDAIDVLGEDVGMFIAAEVSWCEELINDLSAADLSDNAFVECLIVRYLGHSIPVV